MCDHKNLWPTTDIAYSMAVITSSGVAIASFAAYAVAIGTNVFLSCPLHTVRPAIAAYTGRFSCVTNLSVQVSNKTSRTCFLSNLNPWRAFISFFFQAKQQGTKKPNEHFCFPKIVSTPCLFLFFWITVSSPKPLTSFFSIIVSYQNPKELFFRKLFPTQNPKELSPRKLFQV